MYTTKSYDVESFVPKIFIELTSYKFKYYNIVSSNKNTFCCAKNPTKDKTFCYVEANEKKKLILRKPAWLATKESTTKKKRRLNNNNTKSKSNVMVKKNNTKSASIHKI